MKSIIVCLVFELVEKDQLRKEFKLLSKFTLVLVITTSSSKVLNFTQVPLTFSVLKTCRLNYPKILFHKLKERLLFRWNSIYRTKAMYQEEFFAVEKWQN